MSKHKDESAKPSPKDILAAQCLDAMIASKREELGLPPGPSPSVGIQDCWIGENGGKHYPTAPDQAAANSIQEVRHDDSPPSCHVCGTIMGRVHRCGNCGTTTGVGIPTTAPSGDQAEELARWICHELYGRFVTGGSDPENAVPDIRATLLRDFTGEQEREIEKLRKERDALERDFKSQEILATSWEERFIDAVEKEENELEARERAETALREARNQIITEAAIKVQQTILLLRGDDCLAEAVMEAVLALKSASGTEGTKQSTPDGDAKRCHGNSRLSLERQLKGRSNRQSGSKF